MLVQKGFESDPVAAWTKAQEKVGRTLMHTKEADEENESSALQGLVLDTTTRGSLSHTTL